MRDITILPMTKVEDALYHGDLLVENGQILAMGETGTLESGNAEVFPGEGKVALPGFVNTHTHLAMVLLRSYADDMDLQHWLNDKIWPREAKLKPSDVYLASLLGTLELISSGTTTFADMYFYMDQVAQAVAESGLRACLCKGLIPSGADTYDASLAEGLNFALSYQGAAEGRIRTMLGPHAPYTCPPDFLRLIKTTAQRENLGLHIHLSETQKEVEDCLHDYGQTPPQLLQSLGLFDLPLLAAHCVWARPEDYPILARARGVTHCPTSNLKIAAGIAPVSDMLAAGVNVALGTDGACSNNRLEMLQEIKLTAILAKTASKNPRALPAFQALQMATLGGARALGLAAEIGSLEVGKRADISIFDFSAFHLTPCFDSYSHMAYAALPSDAHSVMVDGRWLYRERKFVRLDAEAIRMEANRAAWDLVKR